MRFCFISPILHIAGVIGLIIGLSTTISWARTSAGYQYHATQSGLAINVHQGLYTIHSESASLQDVLLAIGERANIEIHIDGELNETAGSFNYQGVKLSSLLANLLRGYSTVMFYDHTSPTIKHEERLPSQIWLYAQNNPSAKVSIVATEMKSNRGLTLGNSNNQQIERLEGLPNDAIIQSLGDTLKSTPDPLVRQHAIAGLAKTRDLSALSLLEQGLSDHSPQVRRETAKALGEMKGQQALLWLGQLIMGDTDHSVREEAIRSLVQHGNPAALAFVQAATKDKTNSVRKSAQTALSQWTETTE